jgi:hypothetical protein
MSDPRDFGPRSRDSDASTYLAWLAAAAAGLVIVVAMAWGVGERPRTATKSTAIETTGQSPRPPATPAPSAGGATTQGAPASSR